MWLIIIIVQVSDQCLKNILIFRINKYESVTVLYLGVELTYGRNFV